MAYAEIAISTDEVDLSTDENHALDVSEPSQASAATSTRLSKSFQAHDRGLPD